MEIRKNVVSLYRKIKKRMITAEAYNNIHLVIMAIERGAQLMKVSPKEMYMRLKAQGLIHNFCCHTMRSFIAKVWIGSQLQQLRH